MGVQVDPYVCDANKLNQVDREEKMMIEQSARKVGDQWIIPYHGKGIPPSYLIIKSKQLNVWNLLNDDC
jgi:hypothetical protein